MELRFLVAGIVTEGNRSKSERLHQEVIAKNEVIMLKGHNVQYGAPVETMIYLGGGKLVEVGYANEGKADILRMPLTKIQQPFLCEIASCCSKKYDFC